MQPEHQSQSSCISLDEEIDVDALVADAPVEHRQPSRRTFSIEDQVSANWLVKKVVAARQYAAQVKIWAELELRRSAREEQSLMFLFGRQIEGWTRSEIKRLGGRKKSIALPGGTVAIRTVQQSLRIDDEMSVIEWAKANCPTAITVSTKLSKTTIADHFKSTGELPSGTHIEPESETFLIR